MFQDFSIPISVFRIFLSSEKCIHSARKYFYHLTHTFMVSDAAYLGQVNLIAFDYPPRDWNLCWGQLLAISDNPALYSILSCEFGGDCRNTFALPDLRGMTVIGIGQRPGLSNYLWGQVTGFPSHTLSIEEIPAHAHLAEFVPSYNDKPGDGAGSTITATATVNAFTGDDGSQLDDPEDAYWAQAPGATADRAKVYTKNTPNTTMNAGAIDITVTGGGGGSGITGGTVVVGKTGGDRSGQTQPFSTMQPSMALHYCICMDGIYPPRS